MSPKADIPPAHAFVWTIIESLRALGGSGRNEEINEEAVKRQELTEEQQLIPSKGHPHMTEVEYRLAWARSHAKMLGLATNSQRGVWSLTEIGQSVTREVVEQLKADHRRQYYAKRRAKNEGAAPSATQTEDDATDSDRVGEADWKEDLLGVLKEMDPSAFERLAKRLLREAGFVNVTVTGRAGDGGIDGSGVYRMSLVSFPVYFQCKRYKDTVGSSTVRDFRGAMVGRGDKGLLITTGRFTADAKAEATRDGAPPIDLIDGDELADLLCRYGLGVTSTPRTVYDISVDRAFFDSI